MRISQFNHPLRTAFQESHIVHSYHELDSSKEPFQPPPTNHPPIYPTSTSTHIPPTPFNPERQYYPTPLINNCNDHRHTCHHCSLRYDFHLDRCNSHLGRCCNLPCCYYRSLLLRPDYHLFDYYHRTI